MRYNLELRDGFSRTGRLTVGDEIYRTPCVLSLEKIKNLIESLNCNSFVPIALKNLDEDRFKRLRKDCSLLVFNSPLCSPHDFVSLVEEFIVKPVVSGFTKVAYAPAIATAYNIPILAYFGFDLFDTALAEVAAEMGIFMLESGEVKTEELKYNPCNCKICSEYGEEVLVKKNILREHNINIMHSRAKLSRELIRMGELRNFVESEVKHNTFFTAVLRLFDSKWSSEHPYPRFRKSTAKFCSQESFSRPEVMYFLSRSNDIYTPKSRTVIVLPCSAKKPYLLSKTHRNLRNKVSFSGINEIIVSSPLVTPRELELCYPACKYDVAVTGTWGCDEVNYVAEMLSRLIDKFETVGGYVSGGYRKVFERACEIAGVDGVVVESTDELKKFVDLNRGNKFNLYVEMFRHLSLYQFGIDLVSWTGVDRVRGKYPKLELVGNRRIARVDISRGMLDIYIPEFLIDAGYTVKIDDFKPKGTIFAAGVLKARSKIKPGDIVAFYNDRWIGVGIARTAGAEMEKMDEGYAIDVKRVFERY